MKHALNLTTMVQRTATGRFVTCVSIGLLLAFSSAASNASAAEPSTGYTAAVEGLYRLDQLPRLLPSGTTYKMFSSYDRKGGNDDGFAGTYSKLRIENGDSVLAEMKGPGCIQRIHLPHSIYHKPGLLGRKGEHIRVYLDGQDKPAIDVPLEDLFRGKVDGFPKPLVGEGSGGHYCYVPIPYRDGCKVVVQGTAIKFYAVAYRSYPSAEGVETFSLPPSDARRKALAAAAKAWSSCGEIDVMGEDGAKQLTKAVDLKAGESIDLPLPAGPRMVRAVCLSGSPEALRTAEGTRLEIRWDGESKPAVDVPLEYLFCQAMRPDPFRSYLVGVNDQGWYNFMPMPYGKSATITLKAKKPLAVKLDVMVVPLPAWQGDLGYFHAVYHESLPTQRGVFHPMLTRTGRGHYVGTYLVTGGRHESKMPGWLEGDEWFTCDGELRIHGTGTEDFFNCGWYSTPGRLMGPCAFPLHGFPVFRQENKRSLAAAFRWQVPDPVPYEKEIEAKLEHGGANNAKEDYRTAAFFYDAAP